MNQDFCGTVSHRLMMMNHLSPRRMQFPALDLCGCPIPGPTAASADDPTDHPPTLLPMRLRRVRDMHNMLSVREFVDP